MNLLNLRTNSAVNLDGVSYRVRSCRPVADSRSLRWRVRTVVKSCFPTASCWTCIWSGGSRLQRCRIRPTATARLR